MDVSDDKEASTGRGASRAAKSGSIREQLLKAAEEVIGEMGYERASVTLITQKAGYAQGTFYNYFESRQHLFDELAFSAGQRLQAEIRKKAIRGETFEGIEERAFRAFFDFLHKQPSFRRLMHEAEHYAGGGHRRHFEALVASYKNFLATSWQNGDFPLYSKKEMEVIVILLLGARSYMSNPFFKDVVGSANPEGISDEAVQTYMRFILYGLKGKP